MSNYSFLSEVMRTQYWMMDPGTLRHFQGILSLAQNDMQAIGEIKWGKKRSEGSLLVFKPGQAEPEERLIQTSYPQWYSSDSIGKDDQIIHVLPIKGPVTHGGAECSYGTRQLADRFVYADLQESVVGHLVILDTPGGSATANDLDQVFAKARKPVVALIRGMNASKGVWVSSFIPHVFAERPDVEIGCVGVMAVMEGTRNGINTFNNVYYEVYADNSTMKNNEYREAIQNDNTKPTVESLNKLEAEFRATVKRRWPNVPEEKLTGNMYLASEVIGELVDGIKSYSQAVNYIFELAGVERKYAGKVTTLGVIGTVDDEDDEEDPDFIPEDKKKRPGCEVVPLEEKITQPVAGTEEPEQTSDNTNPQMIIPMNKEFLEAIPGMGAVAVDDKGLVMLTEEQSQVLQSHLASGQAALSLVETHQTTITGLQQQVQEKDLSIKELSEATGKGITQPAPTNDNGVEKVSTVVDGPIVSGNLANYKSDMNALRSVLSENGFMNK